LSIWGTAGSRRLACSDELPENPTPLGPVDEQVSLPWQNRKLGGWDSYGHRSGHADGSAVVELPVPKVNWNADVLELEAPRTRCERDLVGKRRGTLAKRLREIGHVHRMKLDARDDRLVTRRIVAGIPMCEGFRALAPRDAGYDEAKNAGRYRASKYPARRTGAAPLSASAWSRDPNLRTPLLHEVDRASRERSPRQRDRRPKPPRPGILQSRGDRARPRHPSTTPAGSFPDWGPIGRNQVCR